MRCPESSYQWLSAVIRRLWSRIVMPYHPTPRNVLRWRVVKMNWEQENDSLSRYLLVQPVIWGPGNEGLISGISSFLFSTGCRSLPSSGFWGLQDTAILWLTGIRGHCHLWLPGAEGPFHPVVTGGCRSLPSSGFWVLQSTAILWLTGVLGHCHLWLPGAVGPCHPVVSEGSRAPPFCG